MDRRIGGVRMHFVEHGHGIPLVALHGAGVDHRETEAAVEAIIAPGGYRRVYPDLPGMGRSSAEGLTGNQDVVRLLGEFVEALDAGPVLLLGHSYGGYLARGVAARRPDLVRGLALMCPAADRSTRVPGHEVVHHTTAAEAELDDAHHAGFAEYFVVRTPTTARRYRNHVLPGKRLADRAALGRIFADWTVDLTGAAFNGPTLIAAGRNDSVVGYADATELVEHYRHATLAVIDGAGHALLHERPELVAALVHDWLQRAGLPLQAPG